MDTPDTGIIPIPDRMEQNGARFLHAAFYGTQLKMYEPFTSGIFLLIFSGDG